MRQFQLRLHKLRVGRFCSFECRPALRIVSESDQHSPSMVCNGADFGRLDICSRRISTAFVADAGRCRSPQSVEQPLHYGGPAQGNAQAALPHQPARPRNRLLSFVNTRPAPAVPEPGWRSSPRSISWRASRRLSKAISAQFRSIITPSVFFCACGAPSISSSAVFGSPALIRFRARAIRAGR